MSSLLVRGLFALCAFSALSASVGIAQESSNVSHSQQESQKNTEAQGTTPGKKAELPAQIDRLETKVRFGENGDSRKEVHTLVHINNELGARQFARLSFDYNRSFQQVELPLVRITHASGGTADILPSAISDQPNPAVVDAPAYQDVRVKSIRILGLEPGDTLEYRVVTTTTHHPLAPDIFVAHDFARDNVAANEIFEIDLPRSRHAEPITSRAAHEYEIETTAESSSSRVIYRWKAPGAEQSLKVGCSGLGEPFPDPATPEAQFDIVVSTLRWASLPIALKPKFRLDDPPELPVKAKAEELTRGSNQPLQKLAVLYDFVSTKIRTVDVALGSTGYRFREPGDVLASGYGVPEDKAMLLSVLARSVAVNAAPALVVRDPQSLQRAGIPENLTNVLVIARVDNEAIWLDPSAEVAPFGVVSANLRGKPALLFAAPNSVQLFEKVASQLPFAATQRVNVDAAIGLDGTLKAKARYAMRGDNELLLRMAFHRAPKEKWNEVAQLLALSDGFRGKVTSVSASDPYATKQPFTVEYEITQPKFVDWSQKPVRIPAVLPLLGLPEAAPKTAAEGNGTGSSAIELGTPLDVEASVTLRVPPDTGVRAPVGTSVQRDYASFVSEYSARNLTLTAVRRIKFVQREVPAEQARDYAAFVRSVQNDQTQQFTLERGDSGQPTKTNTATRSAARAKVKP